MIGSECRICGLGNYNSAKSLEDGYLEFSTNETSVIEATEILGVTISDMGNIVKKYFSGKWALETINMISDDAFNKTFGKTIRHKVFIIEGIN